MPAKPPPLTKPTIHIDTELKSEIDSSAALEGQVVVHCNFVNTENGFSLIRIWKPTYLVCTQSKVKSQMLHPLNISLYPFWTFVKPQSTYKFTLIFAPLPKTCTQFNLEEQIPEGGGFMLYGIKRNATDVYVVNM